MWIGLCLFAGILICKSGLAMAGLFCVVLTLVVFGGCCIFGVWYIWLI